MINVFLSLHFEAYHSHNESAIHIPLHAHKTLKNKISVAFLKGLKIEESI